MFAVISKRTKDAIKITYYSLSLLYSLDFSLFWKNSLIRSIMLFILNIVFSILEPRC